METYLDYYNHHYANKLKEIDIFIKMNDFSEENYPTIASLLQIEIEEIYTTLDLFQFEQLDAVSFFALLKYSNSDICRLIMREMQLQSPTQYSCSDISYIYEIPYSVVVDAAKRCNFEKITSQNIEELFSHIAMTSNVHT